VIESGVLVSGDFEKKNWPSLEGWVSAERREVMWWRTGVVAFVLVDIWELGFLGFDEESEVVACMAYPSTFRASLLSWRYLMSL